MPTALLLAHVCEGIPVVAQSSCRPASASLTGPHGPKSTLVALTHFAFLGPQPQRHQCDCSPRHPQNPEPKEILRRKHTHFQASLPHRYPRCVSHRHLPAPRGPQKVCLQLSNGPLAQATPAGLQGRCGHTRDRPRETWDLVPAQQLTHTVNRSHFSQPGAFPFRASNSLRQALDLPAVLLPNHIPCLHFLPPPTLGSLPDENP